jgi:hypothetical protein
MSNLDMRKDGEFELVKSERLKIARGQRHLAAARGLGLRILQRIECTGVSSYESVLAIASCLNLPLVSLTRSERPKTGIFSIRGNGTVRGVVVAFFVGATLMSVQSVVAEEVFLTLRLTENRGEADDDQIFETQVRVNSGTEHEIRMEGGHRLVVLPEILSDNVVSVSLKIYEFDPGDAEPLVLPRVAMRSGQEGTLHIGEQIPFQADDADSVVSQTQRDPPGLSIKVTPIIIAESE